METQIELAEKIQREITSPSPSVVRLVEDILHFTYVSKASDIHIDPAECEIVVRERVHGDLRDIFRLPKAIHSELLTRLKILSDLRTDEHSQSQDGRFSISFSHEFKDVVETIDVRISIAPTYYGENAVLRLLTAHTSLTSLETLGLSDTHQKLLYQSIERSNGLILITGPTGSGKTSTLYTLLQLLNKRSSSIITIEDPIEYSIPGINQLHAQRTGFTFAEGLRSILRQDPNIIGIGEIRDQETATLAVHAALTGHLVLSTLHTSDAYTAIPRLLAMGIEPYLIASTLIIVIHQRLVPRLCTQCRRRAPISKELRAKLSLVMPDEYTLPRARFISAGCEACDYTGKEGRIGVFEILTISNALRDSIISNVSVTETQHILHKQGMQPLWSDALRKAMVGSIALEDITTFLYE